jgi:hypothetical protein
MSFNYESFFNMSPKEIKNICAEYGIMNINNLTLNEILEKLNSNTYLKKCDMYLIPTAKSMYRPPLREKYPESIHDNAKNWILWDCFQHNNTRFKIMERYKSDDKIKELYSNCDPIFHTNFVLLKAKYIRSNLEFLIKELKKEKKLIESNNKWHEKDCDGCNLSKDIVKEYQ